MPTLLSRVVYSHATCLVPSATVRTRGLPLTKRLLCQLSYKGLSESTSAVPEREHPVGCGVSLHGA
ncbi:hypothetical protein RA210_U140088 [Rubrivivax sp. A210]|nr:hypothetical protein RA210_U140088 [Rubrivivax sp. A210]